MNETMDTNPPSGTWGGGPHYQHSPALCHKGGIPKPPSPPSSVMDPKEVSAAPTSSLPQGMANHEQTPATLTPTDDGSCGVEQGLHPLGKLKLSPEVAESMPVEDDDLSESDGEVSKIDFTGVNLRTKKKRVGGEEDSQDGIRDSEQDGDRERPMSWEGELSDAEMSRLDEAINNGNETNIRKDLEETSMEGVQICGINNSSTQNCINENKLPLKFGEIVPEKIHIECPSTIRSQPIMTPHTELPVDIPLLSDKIINYTPSQSPLQQRHLKPQAPTPSPDSAIHSAYYSPTQSPVQSRHLSGFSSPYSHQTTPSLSRNNSDASQYGGSQHSYSSTTSPISPTQFSPSHSPIQSRHHVPVGYPSPVLTRAGDFPNFTRGDITSSPLPSHHMMAGTGVGGVIYSGVTPIPRLTDEEGKPLSSSQSMYPPDSVTTDASDDSPREGGSSIPDDKMSSLPPDLVQHSALAAPPGISRQQLINSPCPICGDKISGFHYGIFSCESCKGFFKRTVQNRKNYVCLRGSSCPVTIATRKKCPACRFEKCLKMGMKLEAIREDRTRGGRSTYQCSYTLPASLVPPGGETSKHLAAYNSSDPQVKLEAPDLGAVAGSSGLSGNGVDRLAVPQLLQEIMEVEHLWHYNDQEIQKMSAQCDNTNVPETSSGDFLSNLCNIADHRLYKIVKWCKSLPLFKNISIDDQISLLINAWCELLLFSCCFRSMPSPGEIRVSLGKSISLDQAKALGLGACIERMLNFTEHLRRLKVDKYEYVAMKVIVLLTSDASDLKEPEKVRASQEKALQALQHYTLAHYPDLPSKFGELLLRIPELQRTCQVGKEMLSIKNKEGEGPSFNLLMELLRGDH